MSHATTAERSDAAATPFIMSRDVDVHSARFASSPPAAAALATTARTSAHSALNCAWASTLYSRLNEARAAPGGQASGILGSTWCIGSCMHVYTYCMPPNGTGQPASDAATRPRNIIFMVSDGFGPASVTLARVLRQQAGEVVGAQHAVRLGDVVVRAEEARQQAEAGEGDEDDERGDFGERRQSERQRGRERGREQRLRLIVACRVPYVSYPRADTMWV